MNKLKTIFNERILKNKFNLGMFLLIVILILFAVVRILSYAYYYFGENGIIQNNLLLTTDINRRMVFDQGESVNIVVPYENELNDNMPEYTQSTTGSVTLNAGTNTGSVTDSYNVYFEININEYIYTAGINKPEMLVTIYDNNGDLVTTATKDNGSVISTKSVETLYVSSWGEILSKTIEGFDITELDGFLILKEDYSIINNDPTIPTKHIWNAKVTYINLETDQRENEEKVLNSNFVFTSEKK